MALQQTIKNITALALEIDRQVNIMEVCGTHTMSAFRAGLRSLLPPNIKLMSGPGCPVCVTTSAFVDTAIALARRPQVTITTFGDMLRVPGASSSLETERARGGQVKIVYSPLDALAMARQQPGREIVFLGVGFETTAPTVAWTIAQAQEEQLTNYSVLTAHKTMPQAMAALLSAPDLKIDAFMCPGHVSVVTGAQIYDFISRDYHRPCVVTGFEPIDMAQAIAMMLMQIRKAQAKVEIQYRRSVSQTGNVAAQQTIRKIFQTSDAQWRGLGVIRDSGLTIRPEYAAFDASVKFGPLDITETEEPAGCRCGEVLRGACTPPECPLFRQNCTPTSPVGACMVSSEGTCAAYYRYTN